MDIVTIRISGLLVKTGVNGATRKIVEAFTNLEKEGRVPATINLNAKCRTTDLDETWHSRIELKTHRKPVSIIACGQRLPFCE